MSCHLREIYSDHGKRPFVYHCDIKEEYIAVSFRHAINLKYKFNATKFLNKIKFLNCGLRINGKLFINHYKFHFFFFLRRLLHFFVRFESCIYASGAFNK